jgi:hypothetical protein
MKDQWRKKRMSLILIKKTYEDGRPQGAYLDTDDLDDKEYQDYNNLSHEIDKLEEIKHDENKRVKAIALGIFSEEKLRELRHERASLIDVAMLKWGQYADPNLCGREDEL